MKPALAIAPLALLTCLAGAASPLLAAQLVSESGEIVPPYEEIAPLVVDAPLIVDARTTSAVRITGTEAAGLAPGYARFYVMADVQALVSGASIVPKMVGYLVDMPLDARGRPPRFKRERVLLFARPVSGRADQLQLIGNHAQRQWTPGLDALVRRIARESVQPDAPPAITGIGSAFHVPGTLPGEGETQIFLNTETGDPISLIVLRRPGQDPRWAVSLGEIVDDSAGPPARETLLWYRLSCGLPETLPAQAIVSEEPGNAAIARADYQFVRRSLGRCAN